MAEYRDESGARTEPPTPLRLDEARRRGVVPRSADLAAAVTTLLTLAGLAILGGRLLRATVAMTAAMLDGGASPAAGPAAVGGMLWDAVTPILAALAPLALLVAAAAVLANLVQIGFGAGSPSLFDGSRLSPAANLRKVFSSRGLVRTAMGLAKAALAAGVLAALARSWLPRVLSAAALDGEEMTALIAGLGGRLVLSLGAGLLVLGLADFLFQRWQHRRDLRMTRWEILEERKRTEGDPEYRRRLRRARNELARPASERADGGETN